MKNIKKRIVNILKVLIILEIIFLLMNFMSYGSTYKMIDPETYNPGNPTGGDKIFDIGNAIIGIIQFIGSGVSIIVLIIIGIQYMLGSVEERAEYKEKMQPYIIGAIMLFGITNILAVISNLASDI